MALGPVCHSFFVHRVPFVFDLWGVFFVECGESRLGLRCLLSYIGALPLGDDFLGKQRSRGLLRPRLLVGWAVLVLPVPVWSP